MFKGMISIFVAVVVVLGYSAGLVFAQTTSPSPSASATVSPSASVSASSSATATASPKATSTPQAAVAGSNVTVPQGAPNTGRAQ